MDAILKLQNKGKDLILKGQKVPIEGNNQIREGQEKIIKGHELLNKGQDALEEVKELIEKLMSFGVLTTIRISSKESSHMVKKSSQQELKEKFKQGDPSVRLLEESSGKFDYYVKYSSPEISMSQVEKLAIQNVESHNL
ncbi:hypothetical protein SLE2022_119240 [Rubroshorea leprosula]